MSCLILAKQTGASLSLSGGRDTALWLLPSHADTVQEQSKVTRGFPPLQPTPLQLLLPRAQEEALGYGGEGGRGWGHAGSLL